MSPYLEAASVVTEPPKSERVVLERIPALGALQGLNVGPEVALGASRLLPREGAFQVTGGDLKAGCVLSSFEAA